MKRCNTLPQVHTATVTYQATRRNIWATQMVANLVGAGFCVFYFVVLDPLEMPENLRGMLMFPLVLTITLVTLGSVVGLRWQNDFIVAWPILERGERPPAQMLALAQKKVMSGPLVMAGMSLIIWVLAAIANGYHRFYIAPAGEPLGYTAFEALRFTVGVCISGVATASIIFLSSDRLFRRIRPLFFPGGGLVRLEGVRRVRVRKRLRYAFGLVTLVPMLVVVMVVHHKALAMARADADPMEILRSLWYLLGFLVVANVTMGLAVSRLVSDSIAQPVMHLERAMHRVQEGDLSTRARVTDNDELGCLADDFNHMVAGLAERERIKEVFGQYVTREVRDQILSGNIPLDGEVREVTLLFSDLRGFTPMVESTPPKEVVRIMNFYFSEMTQAIREHGGLVLQYVGDEIEAVFGAPQDLPDHPSLAVRAAREMRRRLDEVNRRLAEEGFGPLHHGIGVHTGQAVAANIGSPDRLSYALVGDTVNLASRIQDLTKVFATDILVSATTTERLGTGFALKRLPATQVKGKARPVEIYALEPEEDKTGAPLTIQRQSTIS